MSRGKNFDAEIGFYYIEIKNDDVVIGYNGIGTGYKCIEIQHNFEDIEVGSIGIEVKNNGIEEAYGNKIWWNRIESRTESGDK